MLLYEVFFKLSFAAEGKIRAVWEVTDVVVLAKMLVELIVVAVVRPAVLARTAADRAAQVLTLHVVERLGLVEEANVAEFAKRMAGKATAAELGVGINDAAALLMVFELGFRVKGLLMHEGAAATEANIAQMLLVDGVEVLLEGGNIGEPTAVG
jgi:hypothetical protein